MKRFETKGLIISFLITIKRTWSNFNELMNLLPDHRKRKTYDVAEILMGGIYMFLLRRGSRNNTEKALSGEFEKNYIKLWGLRLPLMETVEKFLRKLDPEEIELLKRDLVRTLIRRKTFDKWRFNGKFVVSIDGTGLSSFEDEPFPGCPHKTSKNGKKTWTSYVLEAKLVCSNGFSISIGTEWLDSSENIGDEKQDCELKAFKRLAVKLKKWYPRMPIIIVADSLYPNKSCFDICKSNNWNFIFTFKDGCLPTVWEEINSLKNLYNESKNQQVRFMIGKNSDEQEYSMFINNIEYSNKYKLNWLEYKLEKKGKLTKYFSHITDLTIDKKNVWDISFNGRLRWNIENQGFNCQKNEGYNLEHKYSRKYLCSMKNFYQLMQIAHMISQLTLKQVKIKEMLKEANITIMAVFEYIAATMRLTNINPIYIKHTLFDNKQLRY